MYIEACFFHYFCVAKHIYSCIHALINRQHNGNLICSCLLIPLIDEFHLLSVKWFLTWQADVLLNEFYFFLQHCLSHLHLIYRRTRVDAKLIGHQLTEHLWELDSDFPRTLPFTGSDMWANWILTGFPNNRFLSIQIPVYLLSLQHMAWYTLFAKNYLEMYSHLWTLQIHYIYDLLKKHLMIAMEKKSLDMLALILH